jgi:hypothetical protein
VQRALKTKSCLSVASYFLFSPQAACGSYTQTQPQKAFLVSFVALDKRNARNWRRQFRAVKGIENNRMFLSIR